MKWKQGREPKRKEKKKLPNTEIVWVKDAWTCKNLKIPKTEWVRVWNQDGWTHKIEKGQELSEWVSLNWRCVNPQKEKNQEWVWVEDE